MQKRIAEECVEKEVQEEGLETARNIKWILSLFIGQEKPNEDYDALVSLRDYPNYILRGTTRKMIMDGLLTDENIRNQIVDFYENKYESMKKSARITGDNVPIWVVIQSKKLENRKVYPRVMRAPNYTLYIALAINVIE